MIAWYGEPKLKAAAMERLREHKRLDHLRQGFYFEDGKGCHLGCLTHANDSSHSATERMFGIQQRIAYWLEAVFESLPSRDAGEWVIESTDAIPVGADMSRCHHHFAVWLLGPDSPSAEGNRHESVRDAIANVRRLHELAASGKPVTDEQWSAAWSADSAARSTDSAAWSARSARDSAAWSARSAADSAARAARSAAWSAWKEIAAKSIEIFRDAPVRQPTASEECDQCVRESMARLASDALVWGEAKTSGVVK